MNYQIETADSLVRVLGPNGPASHSDLIALEKLVRQAKYDLRCELAADATKSLQWQLPEKRPRGVHSAVYILSPMSPAPPRNGVFFSISRAWPKVVYIGATKGSVVSARTQIASSFKADIEVVAYAQCEDPITMKTGLFHIFRDSHIKAGWFHRDLVKAYILETLR